MEAAKVCECGCGMPAPLATKTDASTNRVKGQPMRFVSGHNSRRAWTIEVDPDTGCHVFKGKSLCRGYGMLRHDGRVWYAHRFFYERERGLVPEGLQLDHLCRNRACVNPDHLEPVTPAENVRRGLTTKLSGSDVRAIRASSDPGVVLANRYGVSQSLISAVRHEHIWAGV